MEKVNGVSRKLNEEIKLSKQKDEIINKKDIEIKIHKENIETAAIN